MNMSYSASSLQTEISEQASLEKYFEVLVELASAASNQDAYGQTVYQKKNKNNSLEDLKLWLVFLYFLRKGYKLAAKCSRDQQKFKCCQKDLRRVKLLQMQIEVVSDVIAEGTVCPEISQEVMPCSSLNAHWDTKFYLWSKIQGGLKHSSLRSNFLAIVGNMDSYIDSMG